MQHIFFVDCVFTIWHKSLARMLKFLMFKPYLSYQCVSYRRSNKKHTPISLQKCTKKFIFSWINYNLKKRSIVHLHKIRYGTCTRHKNWVNYFQSTCPNTYHLFVAQETYTIWDLICIESIVKFSFKRRFFGFQFFSFSSSILAWFVIVTLKTFSDLNNG